MIVVDLPPRVLLAVLVETSTATATGGGVGGVSSVVVNVIGSVVDGIVMGSIVGAVVVTNWSWHGARHRCGDGSETVCHHRPETSLDTAQGPAAAAAAAAAGVATAYGQEACSLTQEDHPPAGCTIVTGVCSAQDARHFDSIPVCRVFGTCVSFPSHTRPHVPCLTHRTVGFMYVQM